MNVCGCINASVLFQYFVCLGRTLFVKPCVSTPNLSLKRFHSHYGLNVDWAIPKKKMFFWQSLSFVDSVHVSRRILWHQKGFRTVHNAVHHYHGPLY